MRGVKSQTGKTKIEGLIATRLAIAGVWIIAEGDIRDQLICQWLAFHIDAKRRRRKQKYRHGPGSLFRSPSREQEARLTPARQKSSIASSLKFRMNSHINNLSTSNFCAR